MNKCNELKKEISTNPVEPQRSTRSVSRPKNICNFTDYEDTKYSQM